MKPPLFSCLTSCVANNGSLYGRFLFGPLPIDLSLTVATVLRRSLLHTQSTFTIVSAEIEGATHEYASLPGVQESVLEILLNLGEIVLTSSHRNLINPKFRTYVGSTIEEPTTQFSFAFIRISGPCIVTAKDINWPKGIFCVKPNSVIATLSSHETLTMRLKIACSLNGNQQSFYKSEPKTLNSKGPFPHFDSNSSTIDPSILNNSTLPDFDRELDASTLIGDLDIGIDQKSRKKKFTDNKKPFQFFKSQRNVTTLSSISSSSDEGSLYTSGNSEFLQIKKKASHENVLGKKQTQANTSAILAKNKGFGDSYSVRKQKLIGLPFFPIPSKQSIFFKNKEKLKEDLNTYENKQNEQNTVSFRVFPELFNDFTEPSVSRSRNNNNIKQGYQFQTDNQEVNSLNKINFKNQQNLIDINTKKSTFSEKKRDTEKYELAVSSSSYPVEKVNFLIERDDELAGYRHRIILEVWTNGSISPRQAIFDSIGSLIKLIFNFREPLRDYFNDDFFSETFADQN